MLKTLYFTPASIGYLAQFILASGILGYVASLTMRRWRHGPRDPQMLWLTGFFAAMTGFLCAFWGNVSLAPGLNFYGLCPVTAFTALGMLALVQFAYHFPDCPPMYFIEARLALGGTFVYAIYEVGFAVYRWGQLQRGRLVFRPDWADIPLVVGAFWVLIMLIRQLFRVSAAEQRQSWLRTLWRPRGAAARTIRTFFLIFLLLLVLSISEVLFTNLWLQESLRNTLLSVGMMIELFAFAMAYLNYFPETSSFVVRIIGISLFVSLTSFGSLGWLIGPLYLDLYEDGGIFTDHQTLRFRPTAQGAYDIAAQPFTVMMNFGNRLALRDGQAARLPLAFPFAVYGHTWRQVYVSDDGVVTFARPIGQLEGRYDYGSQPAIFALYTDLVPAPEADVLGHVYCQSDAERLVITWDRLPERSARKGRYTVQLTLLTDGSFTITYHGIPALNVHDLYQAGHTSYSQWLIGVVPGTPTIPVEQLPMTARLPVSGGAHGIVQDPYLALRQHLHPLLTPLMYLLVGNSLLIAGGGVIFLRLSLLVPLNRLLHGVRQVNRGHLEGTVPVSTHDEIGFLTESFNMMVKQLHTLVTDLEARVSERTKQLIQAKEAAEAANRAKSAFLANMSHELRTPLNAILGFAQILAHRAHLPPEQQEYLTTIQNSGDHLLKLINQVLDLAKIEAGRVTLHEQETDLFDVLDEVYELFTLKAQSKLIHFEITRADDVPRTIRTDDVKLRQVLINLIGNAIKFTQEGDVTVRVKKTSEVSETSEVWLQFEISDTGPGMTPEELATLFTAFTQTQTGQEAQEGTGLGLAISQEFVHLLGGDIRVNSVIGRGTTFSFTVPLCVVAPTIRPLPQSHRRVIALAPDQPVYRLLIVDNQPDNRKLLVTLLQPFGFELREAPNGQDAIEQWQSWQPHLIWLDLRMPVMGGYEAAQAIRKLEIRNSKFECPGERPPFVSSQFPVSSFQFRTIIIALSASVFEEEHAAALAHGCDDFLRKPFREHEIFDLLQKHLHVRFVYAEDQQATINNSQATRANELTPEHLAVLPDDVRQELREAVERLNIDIALLIIDRIRPQHESLAEALTELVKQYRFDTLQAWFAERV